MAEEYIKGTGKGRGGWRGGKRPSKNWKETFFARCTEQEKNLLKEYLQELRKGS